MVKGEIYFGENNRIGKHPMVFLADIDEYSFQGVMLTHSPKRDNMKLEAEHFEWIGKNFDIDRTHVVRKNLIKKKEWEPFHPAGKLSASGIALVENIIKGRDLELFD